MNPSQLIRLLSAIGGGARQLKQPKGLGPYTGPVANDLDQPPKATPMPISNGLQFSPISPNVTPNVPSSDLQGAIMKRLSGGQMKGAM